MGGPRAQVRPLIVRRIRSPRPRPVRVWREGRDALVRRRSHKRRLFDARLHAQCGPRLHAAASAQHPRQRRQRAQLRGHRAVRPDQQLRRGDGRRRGRVHRPQQTHVGAPRRNGRRVLLLRRAAGVLVPRRRCAARCWDARAVAVARRHEHGRRHRVRADAVALGRGVARRRGHPEDARRADSDDGFGRASRGVVRVVDGRRVPRADRRQGEARARRAAHRPDGRAERRSFREELLPRRIRLHARPVGHDAAEDGEVLLHRDATRRRGQVLRRRGEREDVPSRKVRREEVRRKLSPGQRAPARGASRSARTVQGLRRGEVEMAGCGRLAREGGSASEHRHARGADASRRLAHQLRHAHRDGLQARRPLRARRIRRRLRLRNDRGERQRRHDDGRARLDDIDARHKGRAGALRGRAHRRDRSAQQALRAAHHRLHLSVRIGCGRLRVRVAQDRDADGRGGPDELPRLARLRNRHERAHVDPARRARRGPQGSAEHVLRDALPCGEGRHGARGNG